MVLAGELDSRMGSMFVSKCLKSPKFVSQLERAASLSHPVSHTAVVRARCGPRGSAGIRAEWSGQNARKHPKAGLAWIFGSV
eukprot:s510_g28.t1